MDFLLGVSVIGIPRESMNVLSPEPKATDPQSGFPTEGNHSFRIVVHRTATVWSNFDIPSNPGKTADSIEVAQAYH